MPPPDDQIRLQLFQAMMDRSSEGVVFVDSEHKIRYWNRAAEILCGLTQDEFPEHDCVKRCVLPSPVEIERLRTDSSAKVLGIIPLNASPDSEMRVQRVIETIEAGGEPWLLVRLTNGDSQNDSESKWYLQARTDHLSELLNRRGFQSMLEENLHRQLALAIIDVDFFKKINDRMGHEAGDRAIQWLATRLTDSFPDAVCIGRLGGDEFGVVLGGSDRKAIARRFREFCEEVSRNSTAWDPVGMTVSIGVAIASAPGVSAPELLSKADKAMYLSKNEGRNRSIPVDL